MVCPHCRTEIDPQHIVERGYRECDACGGAHRMMEPCPAKPGLLELLRGWLEGERGPLNYLAVATIVTLVVLAVLALSVLTTASS